MASPSRAQPSGSARAVIYTNEAAKARVRLAKAFPNKNLSSLVLEREGNPGSKCCDFSIFDFHIHFHNFSQA
jgi:hypothetical protein